MWVSYKIGGWLVSTWLTKCGLGTREEFNEKEFFFCPNTIHPALMWSWW